MILGILASISVIIIALIALRIFLAIVNHFDNSIHK
jgi:hypothetical protein